MDNFLCCYDPWLIKRQDSAFRDSCLIDLGYGETPVTTLELSDRLRRHNPELRVIGVEIDPARVASAEPYAGDYVEFRLGGFNFPLLSGERAVHERVRIIRAFNVLRQYEEFSVESAYSLMAEHVLPGGLMIEGTSDPLGRTGSANVMRRRNKASWEYEAVVFSTSFIPDFSPSRFCAFLPKNLIHRMVPGSSIHEFFTAWERSARDTRYTRIWGDRQWFRVSAERLADSGYRIDLRRSWLRKGWLVWYQ